MPGTLHLSTTRCPDGVAPQRRDVARGEVVIGRAPTCDWVLPDPGRVLSKRHCSVSGQDGTWWVTDISSNGTWLNGQPLDHGVARHLRSGDRVTLGAYEIEARFGVADAPSREPGPASSADPWGLDAEEDRLTGDPFAPVDDAPQSALPGIGLPAGFDPLAVGGASGDGSLYPAADHVSDLGENFRAPRPNRDLVPEGWDHEPEGPTQKPPGRELVPENWDVDHPEPALVADVPVPPASSPQEQEAHAAPAGSDAAAAFAAFAAGAGIAGQPHLDPMTALGELGRAFRAMVTGLRAVMIARDEIKAEFRIEQTMVRASGNNPLKFAADDADALAALLGIGRHGGMSASRALSEALRDIRLHELAVAAAIQQAIRDLLDEVSPARLAQDLPPMTADILPGRRAQRSWTAYEALHARLQRALSDDFDTLFGRSFARAYETALADLAAAMDGVAADDQVPPPGRARPNGY